jgi:predicted nucleic acid-binding protein
MSSSVMVAIGLADQPSFGLVDTCVVIDFAACSAAAVLPEAISISAVSMAELSYGIALARTPLEAAARAQALAALKAWISPLPFDSKAADKYGELAALVLAAGRAPRPRRFDLMIAATAVIHRLPLYTANPADYRGLEAVLDVRPVAL